jgi:arsenate reductase-like glutaredoxin family protein
MSELRELLKARFVNKEEKTIPVIKSKMSHEDLKIFLKLRISEIESILRRGELTYGRLAIAKSNLAQNEFMLSVLEKHVK